MAPHASSWQQEAELVVEGLESVEALWNEEQRAAAGTLAERVYTERFEPRIEVAPIMPKVPPAWELGDAEPTDGEG